MFVAAMLMSSMIDAYSPEAGPIYCRFPGEEVASRTIEVVLEPRPSLKDQPGLWRVIMEMNGKMSMRASAKPIASTAERDVLIRGVSKRKSTYIIGLRDDGSAALNMNTRRVGGDEFRKTTRAGKCFGHEDYINRWLPS